MARCQALHPAHLLELARVGGADHILLSGYSVGPNHLAPLPGLGAFLRRLELSACYELTDQVLLPALRGLPELDELSLDRCKRITDAGIAPALAALSKLRLLAVGGTRVSRGTFAAMGELASLEDVDVSCLAVGLCDSDATALTGGSVLRRVAADKTRLTPKGLAQLMAGGMAQTLSLSFNTRVNDWSALGLSPYITELDLSSNFTVDDEAMDVIASVIPLVEYCNLEKTDITDHAAAAFRTLVRLRVLNLGRTAVGDAVVEAIGASMPELRALLLAYTLVTSAAAVPLLRCPTLEVLKLTGCVHFGDEGVEILGTSAHLCSGLCSLDVGGGRDHRSSGPGAGQIPVYRKLAALGDGGPGRERTRDCPSPRTCARRTHPLLAR